MENGRDLVRGVLLLVGTFIAYNTANLFIIPFNFKFMKLSLGLTTSMAIDECIGHAKKAEKLNYYRIWVGEDIFSREVFTFLSILALKTKKIKLATGITSIYARNTAVLISSIKGLQKLSNERFSLGIGVGGLPELEKLLGRVPENKVNEMRKHVEIIKKFDPLLKLYLGARGEQMLKLGAELCDGVILSGPKSYVFDVKKLLKKEAEKHEKKLEFILWNPILIVNEKKKTEGKKVKDMIDTIIASLPKNALKYIENKNEKEIINELCIAEKKEIKKLKKAGIGELVISPEHLEVFAKWNLE